jgi:hypothetical protein
MLYREHLALSGIRIHNFRSINRKRENDDKKEKKKPISSTNKTDHDITEILLKVASNTTTLTSFTIGFHLRI